MKKFHSLIKTNTMKRKYFFNYNQLYKKQKADTANTVDYKYFESLFIQELMSHNQKKKYNKDLIYLWGKLDMKSFIDYELGNTINLYFVDGFQKKPVSNLEDYNFMPDDARRLNLLDIKYIKSFTLKHIQFKNLFLATYEILDNDGSFRPYVELFMKDSSGQFIEIGYGYDSNNNGNVELSIQSFNYPVFLTPKGNVLIPLTNYTLKIDVYDYITYIDIQKLLKF